MGNGQTDQCLSYYKLSAVYVSKLKKTKLLFTLFRKIGLNE